MFATEASPSFKLQQLKGQDAAVALNYSQPLNIDSALAQVKSLTASSLPQPDRVSGAKQPQNPVPEAAAAPAPDLSLRSEEGTAVLAASVKGKDLGAENERYQRCLDVLSYLSKLRDIAAKLCQEAQQRPAPSARDFRTLSDLARTIDEQNQSRQEQAAAVNAPVKTLTTAAATATTTALSGSVNPVSTLPSEYAHLLQAEAANLTASVLAEAESGSGLDPAQAALFEQESPSLEQARQINAAVDAYMRQEDAYRSPLAANFAAAPEFGQEPAAEPLPAVQGQTAMPAVPDFMQEIPEADAPFVPFDYDELSEEPEQMQAAEQHAEAMLFAAPAQQDLPPDGLQDKAGHGIPGRGGVSPVTQLPAGYSVPKFAGLDPLTSEDFYPQLIQQSPWYALIEQAGVPQGPERSALLYAALIKEPGTDGVLELAMSEEYRAYLTGGKGQSLIEQYFSAFYGRKVKLKLSFVNGTPANAPAALAQQALGQNVEQMRTRLKHDPNLNELFSFMGESLDESVITLYKKHDEAKSPVPGTVR